VLQTLVAHLRDLAGKLAVLDRRLIVMARSDPICRALAEGPGIGPVIATAFAATVPEARGFPRGARLGLVPKQYGSGGKERRLGLSKRGDAYVRR
jgi:transposase